MKVRVRKALGGGKGWRKRRLRCKGRQMMTWRNEKWNRKRRRRVKEM